jgi:hypothetical protein
MPLSSSAWSTVEGGTSGCLRKFLVSTMAVISPVVANSNQVAVSDRAYVGVVQADERLSLSGREDKLDFKTVGFVKVDDGAKIPAAQAMLGQVPI